jgi:hypothetical protein
MDMDGWMNAREQQMSWLWAGVENGCLKIRQEKRNFTFGRHSNRDCSRAAGTEDQLE